MDYEPWGRVLEQFVDENGLVDYAALKSKRADLMNFTTQVARADLSRMSRTEQVAFWINAYNAITMQVIVEKYPVASIKKIWRVWDVKHNAAGRQYSLNDIEHRILRPLDPRVHFALNCASIGCPKLPREPFYPNRLEEQLERETARFINDPQKVRLDRGNKILYVSSLLTWYKKDFLRLAVDLVDFIKKYINASDREFLENNQVVVKSLSYDWGLNEQ